MLHLAASGLLLVFCLGGLLATVGCGRTTEDRGVIQIKGSDTEVNVAQRLAEVFMERHPEVSISVTGGGSGTGIAALINGQTDIANSSREMKPEEIERAQKLGINPVATIFARDRLALIVNQTNPVQSLTVEEIGNIYKGKTTHWKTVGGPDEEISLYGRQSNSGTYIYFRDRVLKGDYSLHMKMMNGNAQIVEGVKQDRAGIGYVGIAYVVQKGKVVKGIRLLDIHQEAAGELSTPPETEKAGQGVNPMSRPLYQYTNGPPQGRLAKFIEFELSPEGQELVTQEGFFRIK